MTKHIPEIDSNDLEGDIARLNENPKEGNVKKVIGKTEEECDNILNAELQFFEKEEKSLTIYFTQKSEEELQLYWDSEEYKELKKDFIKKIQFFSKYPQKVFIFLEFCKLAKFSTEERKNMPLGGSGLTNQFKGIYDEIGELMDVYSHLGKDSDQYIENLKEFLLSKNLGEQEEIRRNKFLQEAKYRLVLLLKGYYNHIRYALPSYALLLLFIDGKLKQFGIDDKTFVQCLGFNSKLNCGYLNFSEFENGNIRPIITNKVKGEQIEIPEKLELMIIDNMKQIIADLLPVINISYFMDEEFIGDKSLLTRRNKDGYIEINKRYDEPINPDFDKMYDISKKLCEEFKKINGSNK